jgi:hypothetical protein
MLQTIGWWVFDPETETLVNRISAQRVRFEGIAEGNAPPSPASGPVRLRFSYEDAETRYPVLLTARYETYGGPGYDHGEPQRRTLGWSIDHPGSAAEWRRQSGAGDEIPPYGLWRRVDETLFDALTCWPNTEATGPGPYRVDSWGGWLNGAWSPRLRRVAEGRAKDAVPVENAIQPYLEPLASEPLSWRFVDAQEAAAAAGLAGVRKLRGGRYFLPREAPLTGFETAIPHLRRSDGEAVMFPCGIRSRLDRDGFYSPSPRFFYADEDVFFQLDGEGHKYGSSPGTWEFELDELYDLGTRRDPRETPIRAASLVRRRKVYDFRSPLLQPLPRLAQSLTAALIDGWLAWPGSPLRLLDTPAQLEWLGSQGSPVPMPPLAESGIALDPKGRVMVKNGYHGGRFIQLNRSITGYLQQDGWSEAGAPAWRGRRA